MKKINSLELIFIILTIQIIIGFIITSMLAYNTLLIYLIPSSLLILESIIVGIVMIILMIQKKLKKPIVLISLIFIIIGNFYNLYIRDNQLEEKKFKKEMNSIYNNDYIITKINKTNSESICSNTYYEVYLKDYKDLIFEAIPCYEGYLNNSVTIEDNFMDKFLVKMSEEYYKENHIKINIEFFNEEEDNKEFFWTNEKYTIYYTERDKTNIMNFIKYVNNKLKNYDISYTLHLCKNRVYQETDLDKCSYINSFTKDNDMKFIEND